MLAGAATPSRPRASSLRARSRAGRWRLARGHEQPSANSCWRRAPRCCRIGMQRLLDIEARIVVLGVDEMTFVHALHCERDELTGLIVAGRHQPARRRPPPRSGRQLSAAGAISQAARSETRCARFRRPRRARCRWRPPPRPAAPPARHSPHAPRAARGPRRGRRGHPRRRDCAPAPAVQFQRVVAARRREPVRRQRLRARDASSGGARAGAAAGGGRRAVARASASLTRAVAVAVDCGARTICAEDDAQRGTSGADQQAAIRRGAVTAATDAPPVRLRCSSYFLTAASANSRARPGDIGLWMNR